uniref:Uncharacterized protein n=1 Tax=Anguilla anguilla TaxID=7936 RepID=A0A0E9UXI7_ANGAN
MVLVPHFSGMANLLMGGKRQLVL